VLAARAGGASGLRIALRYVLPNLVSSAIVLATALLATAIITESNLSFLGLGVPQDVPSWGSMVNEGKNFLLNSPAVSMLPGLAIMIAVAGVNFLGDYLRDVLDPRLKRDQV
jgi:peptide/nickel transport system permease protein